jgi:hypothetical protein
MVGEGETVIQEWHSIVNVIHEVFGYRNALILAAVGVVIAWSLVGFGASITFAGRPWLVWGFWLVVCSVWPALMALRMLKLLNLIPFDIVSALFGALPWIIGTSCLLGTAAAFITARRRNLISLTPCLVSGLWFVLWISVGFMWPKRSDPELSSIVLAMGLLALPVAPLATAPLALAWNRHR